MIDQPQSIFEHLAELRKRIIYAVIAIVVCVVATMAVSHKLFIFLLGTAKQSGAVILVQNTFADSFLAEFHLAVIAGLVLAFPVVLYQLVAFILPALHANERRILYLGLPFATMLFVLGWAFGWFVVVPITRNFFVGLASSAGVQPQITPSAYISFVLDLCNPLGIAFELPLVVMILARIGLVTATFLARIRKYAFLGIMVVAAILSPPDVVSMTIFLVPLYGLYEVSIWVAKIAGKKREQA